MAEAMMGFRGRDYGGWRSGFRGRSLPQQHQQKGKTQLQNQSTQGETTQATLVLPQQEQEQSKVYQARQC